MADPLEKLVYEEAEFNRELLAKALEGRVRLDKAAGTFVLQRLAKEGDKRSIILIALLAQRALSLLVPNHSASITPKALEAATGVKGNTLRPLLRELLDAQLIHRDKVGYNVPSHSMEEISANLMGEA